MIEERELTQFELQIEHLLNSHAQLAQENLNLRRRLARLTQERALLQHKNHQGIAAIKRIINQLRNEYS